MTPLPIIDTHLHLIDPERFSYPWLDGVPPLRRGFAAAGYFAEAQPLGIATALHMEVDVADAEREAETRHALGLHPRIAGAIAACRPEHPGFAAELERLAAIPGVRGLRRILHTSADSLSGTELFRANLRLVPRYGFTFDLCVLARQLPVGRALAAACPQVPFVLDHCGNPPLASGGLPQWRSDIAALAALPNVSAKLSGLVNNAGPGWTVGALRPVAEHVIGCFGWDRVVWGSDYPVCTMDASLTRWVEATRALLSGCSEDEQVRLLSRNAGRLYGLEPDRPKWNRLCDPLGP